MLTFKQFLRDTTKEGGAVNLMFEERLFGLVEILQKAAAMLTAERIPYEVIGGMAVVAHIARVDQDEVMLTRNVDVMVNRSDLDRIQFRPAAQKTMRDVHLVFSGERVKPDHEPNPPIAPERMALYGQEVAVVPLIDLVPMKLNSYRDKDRVHIRGMDAVGLITPEIEQGLPANLRSRLQHIRETE